MKIAKKKNAKKKKKNAQKNWIGALTLSLLLIYYTAMHGTLLSCLGWCS